MAIRGDLVAGHYSLLWRTLREYGPFQVLVVDPPWQCAGTGSTEGSLKLGYKLLSFEEIKGIPVP